MRSHSAAKSGRNDPCPCGSGKKYKRCCLNSEAHPEPEDTPWRRQREASDRLTDEMTRFARRRFDEEFDLAWMDFNQTILPEPLGKLEGERQIFFPYFLFDWDPDRPPPRRGHRPKAGVVAKVFMEEKAKRLSELELSILEQSIVQPVSFYEAVQCDPGHGMVLRDILIGGETAVEEHSGSRLLRPGNIVYAQLCVLPDVTTLSRMSPVPIPPGRKAEIVALRVRLRQKIAKQGRDLTAQDLIRYAENIRTVYLDVRDGLRRPPKLVNTDGDLYVFHTLTFQVGSAQVAFDALAPLAWAASKEEIMESAEVDGDGVLRSVNFDWTKKGNAMHPTWDNTILGNIKLSGRSLVVEVNSANRAGKIRQEIEDRLGILAVYQGTRVETPEQMLEVAKKRKPADATLPASGANSPEIDPEMLPEWQAMIQEEVNAWVHRKVPVLGGRTPMEAVADPDGREIVESLLLDWERGNEKATGPGAFRADVGALRQMLNL
ncbi:MAG: SEC-C metal-binding domain-containing protein [Terracidiphilus sp.]